jgi:hypothetical protein
METANAVWRLRVHPDSLQFQTHQLSHNHITQSCRSRPEEQPQTDWNPVPWPIPFHSDDAIHHNQIGRHILNGSASDATSSTPRSSGVWVQPPM